MSNKNNSCDLVNDVYSYIIDLTVEALKKYIKETKKSKNCYDIPLELKERWKKRMNCVLESSTGLWSKFQEYTIKHEKYSRYYVTFSSNTLSFFPVVCKLSWYIFRNFSGQEKNQGFKSWIWNCLIGKVIGDFSYQQVVIFIYKNTCSLKTQHDVILIHLKHKKNTFNRYKLVQVKKIDKCKKFKNTAVSSSKKSVCSIYRFTHFRESESTDSEYNNINNQPTNKHKEDNSINFILSIVNKIYRRNARWKVILKDGILHVNNRDLLFSSCKCEFFW
ncbi:hypothetical protein CPARA_3gp355 (nucleomorph) [Cryptomonas paramecium]|uniref:Uncharacterized protein n=1 Tax=Cryptomonas paramaecium TaxID=2898 RepID=F2HI89_9CRYP|nr:hypothetical protein CPARA_3gp355 [Cryptomonas paramecium]AEA39013.1 hypothetical protein CPARA_3gp355 [Cryptomonas paramecium]|mmetsp:Transcript_36645/g.96595  ORF Transcript_36645/g.96595 Transcript_36645/m.96595 type:complete len:276 (-) Transcript_36645:16763-17590(-)